MSRLLLRRSEAQWPVGTRLRHYAGSEWEVIEVIGGPYGDVRCRCVVGTERPGSIGGERVGNETTFHAEYVLRSGPGNGSMAGRVCRCLT